MKSLSPKLCQSQVIRKVSPEDSAIFLTILIGIFDRDLRFADPAESADGLHLPAGPLLAALQMGMKLGKLLFARGEERVAGKWHIPDAVLSGGHTDWKRISGCGEQITDASGHAGEMRILFAFAPFAQECARGRQWLEWSKRGCLPIAGTHQNRNDGGLTSLAAFQCREHFSAMTILGGQEIGADQQEDQSGSLQMFVNDVRPVHARLDVTIMPVSDEAIMPELTHMLEQFLMPRRIVRCIRAENVDGLPCASRSSLRHASCLPLHLSLGSRAKDGFARVYAIFSQKQNCRQDDVYA